jgi:hypothetical protein
MDFRLGLSETIEVVILNTTSSRYKFIDLNNVLDDAIVHAITVHDDTMLKSPSFKTVLSFNQLTSSYLTLAGYKNQQFNTRLPFQLFITNDKKITYIKPKLLNLRNCYIEIANREALVIPPEGLAVVMTFYYEHFNPQIHKLNEIDELIEN